MMSGRSVRPRPGQDWAETEPAQLTHRWSRAIVAVSAAAVAALLGTHLAATFLYNAPTNPVSQRYANQIQGWMEPLFNQNWRLFAPNPLSENVSVQARATLANGQMTGWFDLSAQDRAAVLHDPVPGHIAENELRNAWFEWADTHEANGAPSDVAAPLMQRYLLNIVVQRLQTRAVGTISSVQVRAVTTLIPGPDRTAAQTAAQTRTLNWWPVPADASSLPSLPSSPSADAPSSPIGGVK